MRRGGFFSTEKHLKQNWQKDTFQELGKTAHILWTYDFMKKKNHSLTPSLKIARKKNNLKKQHVQCHFY